VRCIASMAFIWVWSIKTQFEDLDKSMGAQVPAYTGTVIVKVNL
jgi:hypothetical protein